MEFRFRLSHAMLLLLLSVSAAIERTLWKFDGSSKEWKAATIEVSPQQKVFASDTFFTEEELQEEYTKNHSFEMNNFATSDTAGGSSSSTITTTTTGENSSNSINDNGDSSSFNHADNNNDNDNDNNNNINDNNNNNNVAALLLCGGGSSTVEVEDPGALSLLQSPCMLNEHSVFVINSSGNLLERCWNGMEWLWLLHPSPSEKFLGVKQLARRDREALYILADDGSVVQRRVEVILENNSINSHHSSSSNSNNNVPGFRWKWSVEIGEKLGENSIDVMGPSSQVDGSLFALNHQGHLLQWCAPVSAATTASSPLLSSSSSSSSSSSQSQSSSKKKKNVNHSHSSQSHSSNNNHNNNDSNYNKHNNNNNNGTVQQQYRVDDSNWIWRDHGTPMDTYGRTISTFLLGATQKVFVVCSDGALYESSLQDPFSTTRIWIRHGKALNSPLWGPPSAPIGSTSFFIISKSKRLFERTLTHADSDDWTWVDHGNPAGRVGLEPDSAVLALNENSVFVYGEDHRLYERYHTGAAKACAKGKNCGGDVAIRWSWKDHGKPTLSPLGSPPGAAISTHSLFAIGTDEKLYERYFRGSSWVYLQHVGGGGSPLTCCIGYGTIPINVTNHNCEDIN